MRALREEDSALILVTDEAAPKGETVALADLLAAVPTGAVDASMTAILPDTHAKTIFNSVATGQPQAVIQTQLILTCIVPQHQDMSEEAVPVPNASAFPSLVPWRQ